MSRIVVIVTKDFAIAHEIFMSKQIEVTDKERAKIIAGLIQMVKGGIYARKGIV